MPVDTSIEGLLERARAIRVKPDHMARYTGLPATTISRAVNGVQKLSYPDFRTLEFFLLAAEELTRRAGAPLNWTDGAAIQALLAAYEEEQRNPPSLPSPEDFELLSSLILNESPDALATSLGVSRAELNTRINEANRKVEFLLNKIGQIAL